MMVMLFLLSGQGIAAENTDNVYPYYRPVKSTLFLGYQKIISPVNRSSCSMSPTCSAYVEESFNKENMLLAWMKSSDRLLRCSNDPSKYELTTKNNMERFKDPVKNDFESYYKSKERDVNIINFTKSSGGEANDINEKLLYQFARELEYNESYEKAVTEYKRLLSYYPDTGYRAEVLNAVFKIHYSQGEYMKAIDWGQKILETDEEIIDANELKYNLGVAYFRLNNHEQARAYFEEVRTSKRQDLVDFSYILEGLSYVKEKKWKEGRKSFDSVNTSSEYKQLANKFKELSVEGSNLKLKDPTLAGALAVIPGLGYLYNGYKETAASSLFVNSLFFWATARSFEQGNRGLGTLLGVFSAGFYSGNIYGSVQTAKRENERIKKNHIIKFQMEF